MPGSQEPWAAEAGRTAGGRRGRGADPAYSASAPALLPARVPSLPQTPERRPAPAGAIAGPSWAACPRAPPEHDVARAPAVGSRSWALAFCVAVAVVMGAASGPPGSEQHVVRRVAGKEGPKQYRGGAGGPGGQKHRGPGTGT